MGVALRRRPLAAALAIAATAAAMALSIGRYQVDPTLGFVSSQSVAVTSAGAVTVRLGEMAPDFTLQDAAGERLRLSDAFGRQPTWITFWASWCGPCRAEAPDTEAVVRAYSGKGLNYLGVNVGEDAAAVSRFMAGYKWRALLDEDRRVSGLYSVRTLPTHVFIGADGIVTEIRPGILNRGQMVARVEKLLEGLRR